MTRRRVLVNLAVFTAISAFFVYWAAANILRLDVIERPYRVTADFEDAMGVLPNAEVTYLGTPVGNVDRVRRIPGGVRIRMAIDRSEEIPEGANAHIWRKSALGEQYVDLTNPPELDGEFTPLEEGDHIPIERTGIPIEFSELLRAADDLISSIDPDDLRTVTRELALGLQGRSDDLRALIVEGARLSETFASRTETLDRLIVNNTRLTGTLARHSGSLVSSLEDLRALTDTLVSVRDRFGPLVDDGRALLAELVPLVRDHRDSLTCVFQAVDSLIDITTTPERLQGLETLLVDTPVATRQLRQATDVEEGPDGRLHQWVRVDLLDTADQPATDYEPNRATPPPVPDVPPCDVEFATTSQPGSGENLLPRAGPTPATGAGAALSAGLGLLVLVAIVRSIRPGPIE